MPRQVELGQSCCGAGALQVLLEQVLLGALLFSAFSMISRRSAPWSPGPWTGSASRSWARGPRPPGGSSCRSSLQQEVELGGEGGRVDARNSQPSAGTYMIARRRSEVGQQLVLRTATATGWRPRRAARPAALSSSSRGHLAPGRGWCAACSSKWAPLGAEEKALGHRTPPGLRREPPSPVSAVSRGVSSYTTSRPHCSHLSLGGGGYSPAHPGGRDLHLEPQASLQVPPPQHTGQSPEPGGAGHTARGLAPPPILRRTGVLGESLPGQSYRGTTEEKAERCCLPEEVKGASSQTHCPGAGQA